MATKPDSSTQEREHESTSPPDWPTYLPHREIDSLLAKLESATDADPAEAARLLRLVTKEVQRLRSMALRLTTEKLAEADREASGILSEALSHADALRGVGLSTLNSRLDEADRLMSTVRESFRLELRAAEFGDAARTAGVRRPRGVPDSTLSDATPPDATLPDDPA